MPSKPDERSGAEERRHDLLRLAKRVIARDGLEAASLRVIAREGAYTTGVLSHHFATRRELVIDCFEYSMREWLDVTTALLDDADSGEGDLRLFLHTAIPLDDADSDGWRLWFHMCGYALREAEAARTLAETDRRWEWLIARSLDRWQQEGLVRRELPLRGTAALLLRMIDGLCLSALVDRRWDRARSTLVDALEALGLPADVGAAALAATPAKRT